jgi:hypothetical protein
MQRQLYDSLHCYRAAVGLCLDVSVSRPYGKWLASGIRLALTPALRDSVQDAAQQRSTGA